MTPLILIAAALLNPDCPTDPAPDPAAVSIDLGTPATYRSHDDAGSALVGASLRVRGQLGPMVVGAEGSWKVAVPFASQQHLGAGVLFGYEGSGRSRVLLLGAAGATRMRGVGYELPIFESLQTASLTVPYIGLRAGYVWATNTRHARVTFEPELLMDIEPATVSGMRTRTPVSFLAPSGGQVTQERVTAGGGVSASLAFRIGVDVL